LPNSADLSLLKTKRAALVPPFFIETPMAKHILLIDGNSIAHANHNGATLSVGGFQVQAIFGFLKSLRALLNSTPGDKEAIVLWDGRAQWRFDIYPEYKGNRAPRDAEAEASDQARRKQMPFLEKALDLLGVKQIRSPLLEADDLAGYFSRTLGLTKQITLVSGDRDWITLVSKNVVWFDPIRDRRVDLGNLLPFTGYYTTDAYVQGKALTKDVSDNIPGIDGFGDKTSQLFLAKWQDVNEFFRQVDAGEYTPASRKSKNAATPHPEQILASPEGRAIFQRNIKLMDLRLSRAPEPGEVQITRGTPNPTAFLQLCERLAFASILRERRQFLASFGIDLPGSEPVPTPAAYVPPWEETTAA
jgi:DNA polymerase-1